MAEYIVLFAFLTVVSLILFITNYDADSHIKNFTLILVMAFNITMTIVFIVMYRQLPHHGNKPTISDVPENAHFQEHKSITNNDTIITYTIEWNDWNGKITIK